MPIGRLADASDAALAVLVAQRRQEALEEVYRRHAGAILSLALRVVRDRSMAEEVVQEVIVRLWRAPERFDASRGSLRSFLLADAHGRSVDVVRSEAARKRREEAEALATVDEAPDDVHGDVVLGMLAEDVRRALSTLPREQREAIELAYLQGHTYREVAALLDEPEGTIKSRIRIGLTRLQGVLAETGATA